MPHIPHAFDDAHFHGPADRHFSRVGAVTAISGLIVYATAAVLHPGAPPHETRAAFADYAREPLWGVIHLGELFGILLMCVTALALAWRLRRSAAGVWAMLAAAAMIVFAGVYAIFTAVDGVALGVMVRRLAEAGPEQQLLLYETAYAVRQVEAGLFGIQWFMFGVGAGLFAVAFFKSELDRPWSLGMTLLSGVASVGTLAFGVVQAQTGFSELSMAFQAGLYAGVLWIAAAGVFLHRSPEHDTADRLRAG